MTLKEFRQQIKLRYTANVYENVSDRDRKFYRLGFKSGYKLARQFFKSKSFKQANIKEIIKYVTINDIIVPENVKSIISAIANQLSIDPNQITAKTRIQSAVIGRSILINVLRDKYKMSFEKIGALIGRRDHTTIMHHVNMKIKKEHFWKPNDIIWSRYYYIVDNVK
jgi:chromosomal replication initiator protein